MSLFVEQLDRNKGIKDKKRIDLIGNILNSRSKFVPILYKNIKIRRDNLKLIQTRIEYIILRIILRVFAVLLSY